MSLVLTHRFGVACFVFVLVGGVVVLIAEINPQLLLLNIPPFDLASHHFGLLAIH